MPLTKPNQELRRDLKAAAFALEDAALELFSEAQGHEEAEFLAAVEKISKLHDLADRLKGYAEEVKAGQVERNKAK